MNSIIRPTTRVGLISIKQDVGGEEKVDSVLPIEMAPVRAYRFYSTKEIREYLESLIAIGLYDFKNGVAIKKSNYKELQEERIALKRILTERESRWREIHTRKFHRKYEIEDVSTTFLVPSVLNCNVEIIPSVISYNGYEMRKKEGDKVNKIHKGYTDRKGIYHPDIITKDCIAPYTRSITPLKMKDLIILHRSGRLAVNRKITLGTLYLDEAGLENAFRLLKKNGAKFEVILPDGGIISNKEYGAVPMLQNKSNIRHNTPIPLEFVGRRVLKPEIDGANPEAKRFISGYRSSNMGFSPIYEYDEFNHHYEFVPDLLSYNQVEYSDKSIILVGTVETLGSVERKIRFYNRIENGYHNFTKQLVIHYDGQTSRCTNKRVTISEDGEVQVFGLNLKGTPEENLKGYLRSFDRVKQRFNEEALELLEIAHEQDGRQTIENIEHDLRFELRHLRTRSASELYYLIMGVEEERTNLPDVTFLSDLEGYVEEFGKMLYIQKLGALRAKGSKKEDALLRVLQSFKSTKDIEEEEGKGLTSDLEDLVTIENSATDESYKRSKNLFNQKMGILNRNQNPLRMEGEVTPLKTWEGRGGPISFPTNEDVPERNIKFVQRSHKFVKVPTGTMFSRDFWVDIDNGRPTRRTTYNPTGAKRIVKNHGKVKNMIERVLNHPLNLEKFETKEEPEIIALQPKEPRAQASVINFPVPLRGYGVRKITRRLTYRPGTMFPRVFRYTRRIPITWREKLSKERGRMSPLQRYRANNGQVPTARYFDNRLKPETVWKKVSLKQFLASEMKPYQFSGRIAFDEKKHEFVRIPHNKPSSYRILHTIGDGKNNPDHYIIEVNGRRLYAKGDVTLLDNPAGTVSFTGTRQPSDLTKEFVKETVKMFLKDDDYVTIGGGAEGCDTIMHHETIRRGGKTIMVLAGGFNQWFKKGQIRPELVLKNGGLILSEHEPDYKPSRGDFVMRNWVIAGLSERLVVFEGGKGTTHCANFGAELGKELLVQGGTKTSTDYICRLKGIQFYPLEGHYPF